ncbi:MAG: AAA family ATPase [Bacteroidales bacterium]|nr:AAA family ATPase [Candidatus Scybalousia scybalohippi]
MKLKRINIHSYKNLDGSYSFESNNGYISLIGLNGSGKSNLLEAISIIFDGLINNNGSGIPFDYEIEYDINGHIYTRKKRQATKDGIICKAEELEYPSSLIACYSGEDLRLWHIAFEKYHMGYFNEAVKQTYSVSTFLYINKYCWKVALISLLCSNNDKVKDFLKNTLKINSPLNVEIDLSYDDTKKDGFKAHAALNWFDRIVQDGNQNINLNIIATTDIYIAGRQVSEEHKAKYVFNFLYLLSQPKKNEKNKIDKLIDDITINVNIENRRISFDDLSEGEKKLILVECITKVLGDENSLVLLDEPDAHTHIAMKKDLLRLITEFEGQIIMTTHSPLFVKMIQDNEQNNLFYIENGKITESRNNLIKKLSNDTLTVLDGTLYSKSNSYLLVEGKSDVNCIKAAINRFPQYEKLQDVSIISFNGASEAKVFFDQAFKDSIDCVKHVAFLFDYDQDGLKEWRNLESIINDYPDKCTRLFYQRNYDEELKPASIDNKDSVLLEDLVHPSAYQHELDKIHSISSFHQLHAGGKISEKPIKDRIEGHCREFTKEQLRDFTPLLQKLVDVFELN